MIYWYSKSDLVVSWVVTYTASLTPTPLSIPPPMVWNTETYKIRYKFWKIHYIFKENFRILLINQFWDRCNKYNLFSGTKYQVYFPSNCIPGIYFFLVQTSDAATMSEYRLPLSEQLSLQTSMNTFYISFKSVCFLFSSPFFLADSDWIIYPYWGTKRSKVSEVQEHNYWYDYQ